MKSLKLTLISATALSLVASVALAGNSAYIDQVGSDNDALIVQSGSGNGFGTSGLRARQGGDSNDVDSTQSGNDNKIGNADNGFDQIGNGNAFTATQSSNENEIGEVQQDAGTGASNTATVTQENSGASGSTNGNEVSTIQQTTGATAGANTATISQDGAGNTVDSLVQNNTGALDNVATISLTGTDNGNSGFTGGSLADLSGASSSDILQDGDDNLIDLSVNGIDNQFGVTQLGTSNRVGSLTITGDTNELGIYQDGTNVVSVSTIDGDRNNIGVRQFVDGDATINLNTVLGDTSDDNNIGVYQDGSGVGTIDVTGDFNNVGIAQWDEATSDVDVVGDSNLVLTVQNGGTLAAKNDITVSVTGSFNNELGSSFTAAGNAEFIAASAPLIFGETVIPGVLGQDGTGNTMMLTVSGDSNLFAAGSIGDNNDVTGFVDGNSNEAAVLQMGDNNIANFTQIGNFNNLGISQ